MIDFTYTPPLDTQPDQIERRHQAILAAMRQASIAAPYTQEYSDGPLLHSNFCQEWAANYREKVEFQALDWLDILSGRNTHLMAVHLVFAADENAKPTEAIKRRCIKRTLKRIERSIAPQRAIKFFAGCYEPDHIVDGEESWWQGSVHAVTLVKAPSPASAKTYLEDALRMPSCSAVYRPMVCKPVTDLPGAVHYAFKSLQFGSVTSRLVYEAGGRKRARKVALRPPARNALVKSMRDVSLETRVIMAF